MVNMVSKSWCFFPLEWRDPVFFSFVSIDPAWKAIGEAARGGNCGCGSPVECFF